MDFSSNAVTNALSAFSLLVALLTAAYYLRDRRHASYGIESEYIAALIAWHGETVELLIRLRLSAAKKGSTDRGNDLAKLSAMIEQGRFFFPNIRKGNEHGPEKPPAYRGYRNLALNFLVASYDLLEAPTDERSSSQASVLQQYFTSIVYDVVQPVRRIQTIKQLTDRQFAHEKSFEAFLRTDDPGAIKDIWRRRTRA
jgi:hypothetical protein